MDERDIKLIAVAAAVIAVAAVVFLLITTYGDEPDEATAVVDEPAEVEGPPAPADPLPGGTDPTSTPEAESGHDDAEVDEADEAEIRAELVEVTSDFFQQWLKPGKLKERQRAVAPYATPAFVDLMSLTDPNPLPEGPVRGEPEVVDGVGTFANSTYVELDGGVNYTVNLVLEPDGWRVNELRAAEDSPAFVDNTPSPSPESDRETSNGDEGR